MRFKWFIEQLRKWVVTVCINVVKCGEIPEHVAMIMDGNRRYARKHQLPVVDGHFKGFEKLYEVAEWCERLGIREVTVYAFSTDNFGRPPDEVRALMDLIRHKCREILKKQNQDVLEKKGARIRWIGNPSLLPLDVQELMSQVAAATANNNSVLLNVAVSYSGQEEISQAIRHVVTGVNGGLLRPEDVSEELIAACLYTHPSPFPQLLIRTSGETRLSDFLLWQVSASCLYFTQVLWPDFSMWHMMCALLSYQRAGEHFRRLRDEVKTPVIEDPRILKFVETVKLLHLHSNAASV